MKYKNGFELEKPHLLEEMISFAESLAKEFLYVRVDLYYVQNKFLLW